jgi:hypothetical protein
MGNWGNSGSDWRWDDQLWRLEVRRVQENKKNGLNGYQWSTGHRRDPMISVSLWMVVK